VCDLDGKLTRAIGGGQAGSKGNHVDDVCEHERSDGYEKDGVIKSIFQHFNNMRLRPTMREALL